MTAVEFNHQLTSLEDALERFAMSLTTNRDDAKDLVQETYLKALSSKDKFIEFTNFEAWAYTIMKNTFINNYRKAVRQNTIVDTTKDLYYLNNSKESYDFWRKICCNHIVITSRNSDIYLAFYLKFITKKYWIVKYF